MVRKHVSEAMAAKLQILALLHSEPQVLTAFGLPTDTSEDRVMIALARIEGDRCFSSLRRAGMSLGAALEISDRLSLALQAGPTDTNTKKKKKTFSTAAGLKVLTAVSLATLFILVGVVVWNVTLSTQGWELGACQITMFTNRTCVQPNNQCNVELKVQRQAGRGADDWYVMSAWSLPTVFSTGRGGATLTRFHGEPLRCCNNAENAVRECCDLMDPTFLDFCDNWPERRAFDGSSCPIDRWSCLFKLDESREGYASAVKPYTAPEILPWVIAIGVICFGLLTGGVLILARRHGCRWRCPCSLCDTSGHFEAESDDDGEEEDSSKQRAKLQQLQNKARSSAPIREVVSYMPPVETNYSLKVAEDDVSEEEKEENEQANEEVLRSAEIAGATPGHGSSVASEKPRPSIASTVSSESSPNYAAKLPSSPESRRRGSWDSRGSAGSSFSKLSADSRGGTSSAGYECSLPGAVASDDERKKHPLFEDADLSRMECIAQMNRTQYARPIIEPVKVKHGKCREKMGKNPHSKTVG
eukprot:TRINITY_DN7252_c0_g1_i1.p1 TRINITY_DN7252_c0_g1~~TRINITY_DN7252_c0_g1_i1.p1  ORF type:complete len:529 (-),score=82.67 TRINITY_DN7252_c0_g1_i1:24-1610(-)